MYILLNVAKLIDVINRSKFKLFLFFTHTYCTPCNRILQYILYFYFLKNQSMYAPLHIAYILRTRCVRKQMRRATKLKRYKLGRLCENIIYGECLFATKSF